MKVLHVVGIPDSDAVVVAYNDGKLRQANFYFPGCGSFLEQRQGLDVEELVLGGVSQNAKLLLPRFDLVFNSICNPDIHRKSLDLLDRFIALAKKPVINHPDAVRKSARSTLYEIFKEKPDIFVPKTLEIFPI